MSVCRGRGTWRPRCPHSERRSSLRPTLQLLEDCLSLFNPARPDLMPTVASVGSGGCVPVAVSSASKVVRINLDTFFKKQKANSSINPQMPSPICCDLLALGLA